MTASTRCGPWWRVRWLPSGCTPRGSASGWARTRGSWWRAAPPSTQPSSRSWRTCSTPGSSPWSVSGDDDVPGLILNTPGRPQLCCPGRGVQSKVLLQDWPRHHLLITGTHTMSCHVMPSYSSPQVQSVADTAQLVATPNKDAVAVSCWLFDFWINIFLKYLLIQWMYCLLQVYGPLIERYKKLEEEVVSNFNSSIQKSWI